MSLAGDEELISLSFPTDLSDSTLSYTETEAASSPNITPGEFSGGFVSPIVFLQIRNLYQKYLTLILEIDDLPEKQVCKN